MEPSKYKTIYALLFVPLIISMIGSVFNTYEFDAIYQDYSNMQIELTYQPLLTKQSFHILTGGARKSSQTIEPLGGFAFLSKVSFYLKQIILLLQNIWLVTFSLCRAMAASSSSGRSPPSLRQYRIQTI